MPESTPTLLTPDDAHGVRRAAETLARAFHDEPLTGWQFPDAAERIEKLPLHFASVLRLTQNIGEVWVSNGAVSCWLPPGAWPLTEDAMVAAGLLGYEDEDSAERFEAIYSAIDAAHERVISDPHWDLWVIGVDPQKQGQGLASTMLAHVLAQIDESGAPCYLETLDESTLSLYRRFGFHVVAQETESSSGLRFWCCVRR